MPNNVIFQCCKFDEVNSRIRIRSRHKKSYAERKCRWRRESTALHRFPRLCTGACANATRKLFAPIPGSIVNRPVKCAILNNSFAPFRPGYCSTDHTKNRGGYSPDVLPIVPYRPIKAEFPAEINLHFPGFPAIGPNLPLVISNVLVCFDCGVSRFTTPGQRRLARLAQTDETAHRRANVIVGPTLEQTVGSVPVRSKVSRLATKFSVGRTQCSVAHSVKKQSPCLGRGKASVL